MASQPLTGVNQQPLVFAQITQGISAPETIKARIVTSSREVDIKSNMFLHLFYNKPYMRDQGYNHAVDQAYGFQVKSDPDTRKFSKDMKAQSATDVGDMKTEIISERELLTLSEDKTWEFKPSVRVADFFANSYGVPIDCWTPCSRIAIARELEAADLIKYELQCGAGESDACAMSAGELARSLHSGDQLSFGDIMTGACVEDLQGHVQLSILFVNENPEIQPLDFRLRLRILPCQCPPVLVKVPKNNGKGFDIYSARLSLTTAGGKVTKSEYKVDREVSLEDAICLGYFHADGEEQSAANLKYPVQNSIEEVFFTQPNDIASMNGSTAPEEGWNPLNAFKTGRAAGAENTSLRTIDELHVVAKACPPVIASLVVTPSTVTYKKVNLEFTLDNDELLAGTTFYWYDVTELQPVLGTAADGYYIELNPSATVNLDFVAKNSLGDSSPKSSGTFVVPEKTLMTDIKPVVAADTNDSAKLTITWLPPDELVPNTTYKYGFVVDSGDLSIPEQQPVLAEVAGNNVITINKPTNAGVYEFQIIAYSFESAESSPSQLAEALTVT